MVTGNVETILKMKADLEGCGRVITTLKNQLKMFREENDNLWGRNNRLKDQVANLKTTVQTLVKTYSKEGVVSEPDSKDAGGGAENGVDGGCCRAVHRSDADTEGLPGLHRLDCGDGGPDPGDSGDERVERDQPRQEVTDFPWGPIVAESWK